MTNLKDIIKSSIIIGTGLIGFGSLNTDAYAETPKKKKSDVETVKLKKEEIVTEEVLKKVNDLNERTEYAISKFMDKLKHDRLEYKHKARLGVPIDFNGMYGIEGMCETGEFGMGIGVSTPYNHSENNFESNSGSNIPFPGFKTIVTKDNSTTTSLDGAMPYMRVEANINPLLDKAFGLYHSQDIKLYAKMGMFNRRDLGENVTTIEHYKDNELIGKKSERELIGPENSREPFFGFGIGYSLGDSNSKLGKYNVSLGVDIVDDKIFPNFIISKYIIYFNPYKSKDSNKNYRGNKK